MTSGPLQTSLVLSNSHRSNVKDFRLVVGAIINVSMWVIWAIYINLEAIYNQPIQSFGYDDVLIEVQIDTNTTQFSQDCKKI